MFCGMCQKPFSQSFKQDFEIKVRYQNMRDHQKTQHNCGDARHFFLQHSQWTQQSWDDRFKEAHLADKYIKTYDEAEQLMTTKIADSLKMK